MGKNTLIVLGFLLLCILLSLKKEEGFATINVSEFETACNADGSTCEITTSGSSGYLCEENTNSNLYTITPSEGERDLHSDSFNLETNSCSDAGYNDLVRPISVLPCTHSGGEYNLTGCSAKCVPPVSDLSNLDGYRSTGGANQLPYISPLVNGGVTEATGIECSDGYIPAQGVCYDEHGNLTPAPSEAGCGSPNIWYNQGDPIKILCNEQGDGHYKYIGCMPGCLPRNGSTEYTTNTDLNNPDREIIQILNRPNPGTDNTTNLMTLESGLSPYNMNEGSLNPTGFSVSGSPQDVQFDGSTTVSFGGDVTPSACPINSQVDGIDTRKYSVEGLYPTCDSSDGREYECLNFNITYDNVPSDKLNIDDFKSTMTDSAAELGISGDTDISSYQNSLYYYRRYKDTDGRVHVEGQIRCDNDENSPFHCVVSNNQGISEYLSTYFSFGEPEGSEVIYSTSDDADDDISYTRFGSVASEPLYGVGGNYENDYLVQKNAFCYNDNDNIHQGVRINWDGDNILTNITEAIDACNESPQCRYITQKELDDGTSKFFVHTARIAYLGDNDYVPNGVVLHPDYNCIFKPGSNNTFNNIQDQWRGGFLVDNEPGTPEFARSFTYTGYKDVKCQVAGAWLMPTSITSGWSSGGAGEANCRENADCIGFNKSGEERTYFKTWAGQMEAASKRDIQGNPMPGGENDCYIKKSGWTQNHTSNYPGFYLQEIPANERNLEYDAQERESYTLKTKDELSEWFRRSS